MQIDTPSSVHNYQLLVQELLKTNPEEKRIKHLMEILGLNYTNESIDRLAQVLAYKPIPKEDLT